MESRTTRRTAPHALPLDAFVALAERLQEGVVLRERRGALLHANDAARILLASTAKSESESELLAPEIAAALDAHRGDAPLELPVGENGAVRSVRFARAFADAGVEAWLLDDAAAAHARDATLELAGRLRTFGVLAVLHRLKQPLNALTLHIELLSQTLERDGGAGGRPRRWVASQLAETKAQAAALASELEGAFAHLLPEAEERRGLVELSRLVREVLAEIQSAANAAGVRVRSELDREPDRELLVRARRGALRRALLAVLQNALEATPAGGTLHVSTRRDARRATISVRDGGAGLAPAALSRAFEPFFSTKEGATGIGLTVARTLIESERGRLRLENGARGGATAELSFPTSH